MFEIQLPARINILGNPSDANEGAHQTISAAVNVFGRVKVQESPNFFFTLRCFEDANDCEPARFETDRVSGLAYQRGFDLQVAAFRALMGYSPQFREQVNQKAVRLDFITDIPRQSGLGGSSVLILLTLLALVKHYQLDSRLHNHYVLGELTQRAEERELSITCGFADRYVPLFGGLAYLDYRGKLFHRALKEEPYCTYEKLTDFVAELPLVMCSTGVRHDSDDVHRPMRARYLDEYKQFRGDYDSAPFMVRIMKEIGDTAWRGKIAILEGDLETFGRLMNQNHGLVDEMMRHCGFTEGAGEANNRLIQAGMAAGALGAKLTGAGGGGSVFMLTRPGHENEVAGALSQALARHGYSHGRVFIPQVAKEGASITET